MKIHGKRSLLNPPGHESVAAIVAEVENTLGWAEGRNRDGGPLEKTSRYSVEPYARVVISDCSRSIELSFAWESAADRRAQLVKVDRLIDALWKFRRGLLIEQKLYVARAKQVKE